MALGAQVSGVEAGSLAANATIENQISIIESINLLRRVVEREGLVNDPEFGSQARPSWRSAFFALFRFSKDEETKPPAEVSGIPLAVLASIGRLRGTLQVSRVKNSYTLEISVTAVDRNRAARLANAVADAFIVDQLETRFEAARRASDWLNDRLQRLREALRQSEEAVSRFRAEHNLVSLGTRSLNEQQLSEISAELVQVETEAAEKQAKYEQAKKILDEGGNLATLPDVIRSGVVSNLRSRLAEVSGREADLVTRYGERHPTRRCVVNSAARRVRMRFCGTSARKRVCARRWAPEKRQNQARNRWLNMMQSISIRRGKWPLLFGTKALRRKPRDS
jgi:uncharacterized protein involved in exopolysaccharide biosynthesis